MPGLSGSQKAYRLATASQEPRGRVRADSTRAAYFLRDAVPVWINGAARTGTIQASIRIDLNTGDEPHRCSFDFKGGSGFVPQAGHSVVIGHGTTANPLFSGRILKAVRSSLRNDDKRPIYRCDAAGHVFELGTTRLGSGLMMTSIAPFSAVAAILSRTSPSAQSMGFTTTYIAADMPVLERVSVGPTDHLPDVLGQLMRSVDATWYVDHNRNIRAFAAVDSTAGPVPNTLGIPSSNYWGVTYTPSDVGKVFTRAHVIGASQPSLADMLPSRHSWLPLASASLLGNSPASFIGGTGVATLEDWLIGGVYINTENVIAEPSAQFLAGNASLLLPSSRGTNTLTVVAANVSSANPIRADRWYSIGGQYLYVSSQIGVYSATVNSIAYSYFVFGTGPGAIVSDLQAAADISSVWQMLVASSILAVAPFLPAGTEVAVYATRTNSAGASEVASLFGSSQFGVISKTFTDGRLSPDGAGAVASTALERGAPSNWRTLTFATRDHRLAMGRPVYVAITSPAEPSGHSISGVFTAQDITIDGFGQLTETKGPIRTVDAGAVRKPTLWQVLQGV